MSFWHIELCRNQNQAITSVASHTRTPGPATAQRHDILLSPRCYWEFGQQSKSQVEQIGHAKITQTAAFNYMSYHFLCKRGIRPARTEQFLVMFVSIQGKLNCIFYLISKSVLLSLVLAAWASPHISSPVYSGLKLQASNPPPSNIYPVLGHSNPPTLRPHN